MPDQLIERHQFGTTSDTISVLGFGGVIVTNVFPETASRYVSEAVEAGVNYFDVGPFYGNAQELLGPALAPYREDCFLACKTRERTAEGAQAEMEESLRLLKTDHFDLYQLHSLQSVEDDVNAVFAPGGAMETIVRARDEGKIRYIGFSAHTEEAALAAWRGQIDALHERLTSVIEEVSGMEDRTRDASSRKLAALVAEAEDADRGLAQREEAFGTSLAERREELAGLEDAGNAAREAWTPDKKDRRESKTGDDEELTRLRAIVSVLAFEPLPGGVKTEAEAHHVLGIAPGRGPGIGELRARFRMLAAIHHPDSGYGSHERMSQLNAAMDILGRCS